MAQNNYIENVRGFLQLFNPTNKNRSTQEQDLEDGLSSQLPEFELDMDDKEIIALTKQWEDEYYTYEQDIQGRQKDNVEYWQGKQYGYNQFSQGKFRPIIDNKIFEALETYLPIATKASPDPIVSAGDADEAQAIAAKVRGMLNYQADRQKLRMKLKKMTRHWALYFLGVVKISWDVAENDIKTEVIKPSLFIFDKDATIDEGGRYTGDYLGQYKFTSARKLMEMFPKKKAYIKTQVGENGLATRITYKEWWTNEYLFFTYQNEVLGKFRNPHWNYNGEVKHINPETQEETIEQIKGKNHFPAPRIPYLFLSVINLGDHPHDETSLIEQNLSNQDRVNKREKQIDKNVDLMNNGLVLSGTAFTKEQAAEANEQLSRGNALYVPNGDIAAAYRRDQAPGLPNDVFADLKDARAELANIFGTSGSTPQGVKSEESVRGKLLSNQLDTSRIGGGVTENIEQVADAIYNYWVQMFYVYYTEPHTGNILGIDKTDQEVMLVNTELGLRLTVTVKDGSMIPKDPLTQRNEAIDLWDAEAIDPITFYTRLDFPNPYEAAKKLVIWNLIKTGQLPPQMMFPDLEIPQAPMQGQPGTQNISAGAQNAQVQSDPMQQQSQQLMQTQNLL